MQSKKQSSLTVILLGPAGSGKGTQVNFLVKKGFNKVEAGELVRAKAKEDSELGRMIHSYHESGRHLPDDVMYDLMEESILKADSNENLVVDGYPRTIGQAKDLDKLLSKAKRNLAVAILIAVSDQECIRRLLDRSVCGQCKTIFIGRDKKICPKCGGQIEVRDYDIDRAAIEKRLEWFNEKVMQAVEFYRRKGNLIEINGEQPIEKVKEDIDKEIDKYLL